MLKRICKINFSRAPSEVLFYLGIRKKSYDKPFIPRARKADIPQIFYSLEERLKEKDEKIKDPELYKKVNIGLPYKINKRKNISEKWKIIKDIKNNIELEKKSKDCSLLIDLDETEKDWILSLKPHHMRLLAENYQIFDHLFGKYAFFYPVIDMKIRYDFDEESLSPVFAGNQLKPSETTKAPTVDFLSSPNELWTLTLTNPDGNLYDNEAEVVHWFVGNIPGGNMEKGEEIVSYMLPIPPRGTGFHRYVFVLYKQSESINFSKYNLDSSCLLKERSFKTYDFYKENQDLLTPAGLCWFQADWDSSVKNYFHHVLKMREPHYEYEFPKQYIKPEEIIPRFKTVFNRYMDLHRDKKELQKWMLLKRLANVHPFHGEKPLLPFPQAAPVDKNLPVWLKNEIRYERDGSGKFRDIYRGDYRPYQYTGKCTPLVKFRPSPYRDESQ